jgi:fermentation-respiration switch protein FrsA (DUF1100 family)
LYSDAEAAWELAVGELGVEPERLVIYGESLGAAVAIELARRRSAAAVVTEAAFTSLPDVGAAAYPFLPVRWLARERYASIEKVAELEPPLLLLHSPADEIVPFAHAERLAAAAAPGARVVRTQGGHNDGGFARHAGARRALADFLAGALQPGSPGEPERRSPAREATDG